MDQLMPVPLTVSCFSKVQIGFPFKYWLTQVVLEKSLQTRVSVDFLVPSGTQLSF